MPFVQPNAPLTNVVNNGNGQLHLTFVNVAQGDSLVLKTPLGRVFLLDCGSVRDPLNAFGNILGAITNPVSGITINYAHLDGIILSHPDRDHYNKLADLAEEFAHYNYTIQNVFISLPEILFSETGLTNWLRRRPGPWALPGQVHQIRLNEASPRGVNGEIPPILVHWERLPDGTDFKIKFVAAGVSPNLDGQPETFLPNGDQKNTASIVTLIEFGLQKFLIMGDATTPVGNFIYNHFSEETNDVELLHIPHHGSKRHSLNSFFWGHVFPNTCVISAPVENDGDHLPAFETVLYAANATMNMGNNRNHRVYKYEAISDWEIVSRGVPRFIQIDEIVDDENDPTFRNYALKIEPDDRYTIVRRNYREANFHKRVDKTGVTSVRRAQLTQGDLELSKDIHITSASGAGLYWTYDAN